MAGNSRSWTPEKRARQAVRIAETKPWLKTTGPKTEAGKAASAQNALRHGFCSAELKRLRALLRAQADYVAKVLNNAPPPT